MEAFPRPQSFGPYRIYAKVAAGGMAEVFLATSTKKELVNQFIAIKKLHPPLNANKPFVNLLVHEAKIGVLLTHPGIAEVYDLGSHKSEFFLAMEYVHGKSLDRALHLVREQVAPLPSKEVAAYIMFELLRALAFAHALKDVKGRDLNIIHRDISPGNILLEYKGNVKLTDFGIATAENRLHVELSNHALGKLVYIPPEQAVNDPVQKSSDLYSLTVVYYELLTGRLPFESSSPSGLYRDIVGGKYHDVRETRPEIPKELSELIHKNLDKSAKKRFQSAPEMFEAFHKYFLARENLDFNSRVVRAYFKKKLAEYLRKCFENEIIEELEVIQNALFMSEDEESFQETKPQIPPEELLSDVNNVPEATVFEADHTNEATRHYPLTAEERKNILRGLPAREAMQPFENFEQLSPSAFELATIPDARLSQVQAKTVSEKLESISINKDERETLRHSQPAMEIANDVDLEAFEQTTFSGRKDKTIILTEDFDATKEQNDFGEERTRVSVEEDYNQALADAPTPQEGAYQAATALAETPAEPIPLPVLPKKKIELPWNKIFIVLASLLILGGGSFGIYSAWDSITERAIKVKNSAVILMNPFKATALVPYQQVAIVFTGESDFQTLKDVARDFQFTAGSVQKLENFFNSAYTLYTGKSEKVIQLVATEPQSIANPLTYFSDLKDRLNNGEVFLYFRDNGIKKRDGQSTTLVVYLHSQDPLKGTFPDEYEGKKMDGMGLVFFEPVREPRIALSVKIAREIARLYGAKDKIERETQLPIVTRGLGEPTKTPLFPQTKAELMGRWVMIDNLQKREINSFEEMIIGPDTAKELGWER